jgi:hypothetical protein
MADDRTYGSTTGDIIWKKKDPKTIELSNKPPPDDQEPLARDAETAPVTAEQKAASDYDEMYGRRLNPMEQEFFKHDMAVHGAPEAIERAKRHMHMRQLHNLDHDLRHDPDLDLQSRVQELMDSGALRIDERGDLYSSIPLGPGANQRILEAARRWQPPESPQETQDEPDSSTEQFGSNMDSYIKQAMGMTGMRPADEEDSD